MLSHATSTVNGCFDKFIIIDEHTFINLQNLSYIDIVENLADCKTILRFCMKDNFIHQIHCEDRQDSLKIIEDIKFCITDEPDKNIIEITSYRKNYDDT